MTAFWAGAISRLDGGAQDGLHLLWAPPVGTAWSVDGFDVQRLDAPEPKIQCYALKPAELARLHAEWRVDVPPARISVQRVACPTAIGGPRNDPHDEGIEIDEIACVDFQKRDRGQGPNPRQEGKLRFELRHGATADQHSEIVSTPQGNALAAGLDLEIQLPPNTGFVALTLIVKHIATVRALDSHGHVVAARRLGGGSTMPELVELHSAEIARVRVVSPRGGTALLELCHGRSAPARKPRSLAFASGKGAGGAWQSSPTHADGSGEPRCARYTVDLRRESPFVRVELGADVVIAIARRAGKVVDLKYAVATGGVCSAEFGARIVDEVLVYAPAFARSITICQPVPPQEKKEADRWRRAPYIARNVQVPFKAIDSSLAGRADEETHARSRLLAGEAFDATAFGEVADAVDDVAAVDRPHPAAVSLFTRANAGDPPIDTRPWTMAMALTVRADWRRMLGFGLLDSTGLVAGRAYEYRITGRFHRSDLEETPRGFQTVPLGTVLPCAFELADLSLQTRAPTTVALPGALGSAVMRRAARKGIEIGASSHTLTIDFPASVSRVVLELEPRSSGVIEWDAYSDDWIPGFAGTTESGTVAQAHRTVIDFTTPLQRIELRGHFFLYAIRESPISGTDDVVEISEIIPSVVYETTAPPQPPIIVGTSHLQQPLPVGDPAVTTQTAPAHLGFLVEWLPPPASDSPTPFLWPPDLDGYPPTDVVGYRLERRRVDTGSAFETVGGDGTLFFGTRGSRPDATPLTWGVDLLDVYPEHPKPIAPVSPYVDAEDVLVGSDNNGPPPGSLHQYHVRSVDAIGRESVPRAGAVVRLEKRRPPPQPVGPEGPEPSPNAVAPAGVRARVLQSSDQLSATDLAILGSSRNAIVLEWGWRAVERDQDPWATEFRIYMRHDPPDVVTGSLSGTATLVGGVYTMSATVDHALEADEMAGQFLQADSHPFRVKGHDACTAGTAFSIRLEPSRVDPTQTPVAAPFTFLRQPTGNDLRPGQFERRVAVQAITDTTPYVFRDVLTLDATHPRARIWVGVSAADDQGYIADELPSSAHNGGRPGNESRVAVALAQARYLGQPAFTVAPPLPDVPELVTNEPTNGPVRVTLDLPSLLPAVVIPSGGTIRLERLGLDAIAGRLSDAGSNRIGIELPDGTMRTYALANAGDQASFLSQIRSGAAARVADKYLVDAVLRYASDLETLWSTTPTNAAPWGSVTDELPTKAERYLHRVRLLDAARHVSAGSAILPQVVRVPSLRSPSPPRLAMGDSATDTLQLTATYRDAFDLGYLVVFQVSADVSAPQGNATTEKAQLLRQPNLRGSYPNTGLRVRLADGTLLAPAASVAITPGPNDGPEVSATVALTVGRGKRASVWALLLTRDGIPSRLAGPKNGATAPNGSPTAPV